MPTRLGALIVTGILAMPPVSLADCPIAGGRPVYAKAAAEPLDFRHTALHRVKATMDVPTTTEVEVRIVPAEGEDVAGDGLAGNMERVAAWISSVFSSELGERLGYSPTVNATLNRQYAPRGSEESLRAQGFKKLAGPLATSAGKPVRGDVWVREVRVENPGLERRELPAAQVVQSRATIRIETRVCVDDQAGVLAFKSTVRVVDLGSGVHPQAQVSESERSQKHAAFLREVQAEAERIRTWLNTYRHPVSAEQKAAMNAKNAEWFEVKVPFQFLGNTKELVVTVTSLVTPEIDQEVGGPAPPTGLRITPVNRRS